jgi:hypothetical protein
MLSIYVRQNIKFANSLLPNSIPHDIDPQCFFGEGVRMSATESDSSIVRARSELPGSASYESAAQLVAVPR